MRCGIGPIPDDLKDRPRLSPSAIEKFLESPAHYLAYKQKEFKETDAMLEGTLIHMAALEPDKFFSEYAAIPIKEQFPKCLFTMDDIKNELDAMKVEYKKSLKKAELVALIKQHRPEIQIWEEVVEAMCAGKIQVKNETFTACVRIAEKIKARKFESKIWDQGIKETYIWFEHHSGVIISMKPDFYALGLGEKKINLCLDIKKVQAVDRRSIQYEMTDSQNVMKAAIYNDGLSAIHNGLIFNMFCFLFVTAKPPYSIKNVAVNEGQLDAGRELYEKAIEAWLVCYENNYWPDEAEEVVNYEEPDYFFTSVENKINNLDYFVENTKRKFENGK